MSCAEARDGITFTKTESCHVFRSRVNSSLLPEHAFIIIIIIIISIISIIIVTYVFGSVLAKRLMFVCVRK